MRTAISWMVHVAQGVTPCGFGKSSKFMYLIASLGAGVTELNEDMFSEKCRTSSSTNWASSGVEIIVLAVETSMQCFKVASDTH